MNNGTWISDTAASTPTPTAPTMTTQTPSNVSGTNSTVGLMMGLGTSVTPAVTGNVLIVASGQFANDTLSGGSAVQLRYGSGSSPSHLATLTGTQIGSEQVCPLLTAVISKSGFCLSGVLTGLVVNTTYWLDISVRALGLGTASISGVTISCLESAV
jgi:hypothetical protein